METPRRVFMMEDFLSDAKHLDEEDDLFDDDDNDDYDEDDYDDFKDKDEED